ncbi:copper resistance protein D [Bordetella ansorpii]|uniref:Copper resistance protein D n=1 Tax=Bordetella ansorpii TaxID=288768 RepID=A0A157S4S0_9BORD|nr:copper homeostasis membrane protein CopD [Bordetella ansorpii]SAI65410.1 copper resistance protein D [Bordetella ansorpii]
MSTLETANVVCRYLAALAPMLVFGGHCMLAACGRWPAAAQLGLRLRPLWRALAVAGLLATLPLLGIQAASITGDPAGMTSPGTLWQVASQTAYGQAWMAKACAAAALCVALCLPGVRAPAWLAVLSGCALAATAASGHARMDDGLLGLAHVLNNILHVLCAAFWLGALAVVPPLLGLWRTHRGLAVPMLMRFSTLGHVAVAGALLTGGVNAWLILRRVGVDAGSAYQQWLAAKILAVLAMVVLALVNRYVLVPRLAGDAGALRRLRRQTAYALCAGALAVLSVAVLGTQSPG